MQFFSKACKEIIYQIIEFCIFCLAKFYGGEKIQEDRHVTYIYILVRWVRVVEEHRKKRVNIFETYLGK